MPRGNIVQRGRVSAGVKAENKAVSNRPGGWSASEARRTHRQGNLRVVRRLRARAA